VNSRAGLIGKAERGSWWTRCAAKNAPDLHRQ
jgi:hypothetical protein